MGLSSALNAAMSGLSLTKAQLVVTSQNIANANVDGYTLKTIVGTEVYNSTGSTSSVLTNQVTRQVNTQLQSSYWESLSDFSFATQYNDYIERLDQMFGVVGDASSIPSLMNDFTNALTALATDPSSQSTQEVAVSAAVELTNVINNSAEEVQELRRDSDASIADEVSKVNSLLQEIESLEDSIVAERSAGRSTVHLEDQLDVQLHALTEKMDVEISVGDDGLLGITTPTGLTLYDGRASELKFTASPTLGVGVEGNPIELVSPSGSVMTLSQYDLQSGSIGALVELRDTTLPETQARLDELASQMALALSQQVSEGVAADDGGVPPAATGMSVDTSNLMSSGDTIELEFEVNGELRKVSFVAVTDASLLPLSSDVTADSDDIVHGIVIPATTASLESQISSALGTGFDVSVDASGELSILTPTSSGTIEITGLIAKNTRTVTAEDGSEIPLFMDSKDGGIPYTGALEDGGQEEGFAQRMVINLAVLNDPSLLVGGGDDPSSERVSLLKDRLTQTEFIFSPSSGIGAKNSPYVGTISDFAIETVAKQSQIASAAATAELNSGTVTSIAQVAYENSYKVDVDEELVKLTELQNAYAANARVLTAIDEIYDTLFSIA
ncbi:Flagellar hook-associated protein 1 [Pseudovibrio axinellae]|uniref:Flagellar hook-associated protein 1 n=1 Tax=Pseudovibrio axinellae TaxID=989403 RepID=A0A161XHH4_9HYPH|nr:flagellar hook-associated protein FlgK [Pseudovibrio axinellae]KZL21363.1 Flagellar hook-associated protein 1 [Pseudovibrio axinellae]SEQ97521.1 flagellar hook-associated protein 1 FlgK [Pseudovibrio axinellae]